MTTENIIKEIQSIENPEQAIHLSRFFKTGKGEYAEGDLFYGVKVPEIRKIAKKYYKSINSDEVDQLIKNPYHEVRLAAIVMLILKYQKADITEQNNIYNLYLDNVNYINNWDLVDISAQHIVGAYLFDKKTDKLWELAKSGHLWSERISVLSTFYFIRQNVYSLTLELSEYFLDHRHDLMHKATGWMLREAGKRDINSLYSFLDQFHKVMPTTMLRYSLEKVLPKKRAFYMAK